MRTTWRRQALRGLLALAWLCACVPAACLSRGDPPTGRQVFADRESRLLGVLPASPDGALRLIIMRLRSDGGGVDLFLVTAAADGSPPSELLLAQGFQFQFAAVCGYKICFPMDARGRLVLATSDDPSGLNSRVVRLDPVTGEQVDLGPGQQFQLSPSGRRLLIVTYDGATTQATLYEADDHAVSLAGANGALFAGEALFYVTPDLQLMRVLPDAAPELVQANVNNFNVQQIATGPLLILFLASGDPSAGLMSIVDPVTLEQRFAPFARGNVFALSSDGHWMAVGRFQNGANQSFSLIEAGTGAEEDFETPASSLFPEWRPGRSELWLPVNQYGYDPVTWLKRPGEPLVTLPVVAGGWNGALFTEDGTYFYTGEESSARGRRTMVVGRADDPTGPLVALNPDGSDLRQPRQLPDGRFLIESFYTDPNRSDISVVDPRTGDSHLLGKAGLVLTVGDRRVLALLRYLDGVGDLAGLDLDGGGSIPIATEFVVSAVAEPSGSDPLGAGVRVAFQFRARFDSPYDGIWLTTLP
jgi:hypothetical protein